MDRTKALFLYSILLAATWISSCKKEDPQPIDPTQLPAPVFSFSGEINGQPIELKAGVDNYYISYSKLSDENGVTEYTSEFKMKNCVSDCPNTIRVKLKDYRSLSSVSLIVDSLLHQGFYSFATPAGVPVAFDKSFVGGLADKSVKHYTWDFGDGTSSVQSSSSAITHQYKYPGIYNVTLHATDSLETCSSSITNEVKVGQVGNSLETDFYTSAISGKTVNLFASTSGGVAPYTYLWDFGDGSVANSIGVNHTYAAEGIYLVSLTVTDAAGHSAVHKANIMLQSVPGCAAYVLATAVTPVMNSKNLSGVIIEWIDSNGQLWTSKHNEQDASGSMFEIVSVEEFALNETGVSAKKITVNIACKLYNGASSIKLDNAKATMVIAY
jgi:PKD repeat protein